MGGSGGGGGGRSLGDTRQLEQRAKEILKSSNPQKRFVFLSASIADADEVARIRAEIKKQLSDIELLERAIDEPIDSPRADYVKQRVREMIGRSAEAVVLLSAAAAEDDWVEWEITKCLELKKIVIGFYLGQPSRKFPPSFGENLSIYEFKDLLKLLR